jgi:hypothetical protein
MSDVKFRRAERNWISNDDYQSWVAYLRESRRAGQPIFTREDVIRAVSPPSIRPVKFIPTEDGFHALVQKVWNPPIERQYQVSLGPDDFEIESYPMWRWWSGLIVVGWDHQGLFESPCPILSISVESTDANEAVHGVPGMMGEEYTRSGWDQFHGTYTYEVDCVSNRDQLFAAFQDGNEDHWEIELDNE